MGKIKFFMMIVIASSLLFSTVFTGVGVVNAETSNSNQDRIYTPDELIVQFKDNKASFNNKELDAKISERFEELGLALIKVPTGELEQYKVSLAGDVNVKSVQYNYIYKPLNLSNDSFSNWQWGLHNTGQTIEGSEGQIVEDVDINLPEAWKLIENKDEKLAEVVVAVLDDGVQTNHPDLKGSIWVNTKEISSNQKDDDGNGYVDDVNGWDFYNGDPSVADGDFDGYHGTHISGTIAATTNNNAGIAGIAPNVKLMPLKFINGNEGGNAWDAIDGIRYAEKNGAKIVIASWGSKYYSPALEQAIKASKMLFVTAAGNDGIDNDGANKNYPSSYDSSNIISVGAVDKKGERSFFSNYGTKTVDLVAPGESTYSTIPNNSYDFEKGTSMAAAHVTGVAALLAGVEKEITPEQIKQVLTLTGKTVTGARGTVSGKMLDAKGALEYYIVSLPLVIDPIYDSSRYFSGTTEPGAIVRVDNNLGDKIIDGAADVNGKFKIRLPKHLPTGTELTIYSKKGLINSKEIIYKVLHDNVKPVLEKGSLDVTDKSTKLEGKVSEFASVYIKIADEVFSGETNEDGTFSFDIPKPFEKNTEGVYILTDLANPSNTTSGSFVVKDSVAPHLIKDPVINDMTTSVEGQVNKAVTVQLKVGNKTLHSMPVQTDKFGNFKITIPRQKMGTVITVIMVDDQGQQGKKDITVGDGTGPVISKLNTVFETSRSVQGYVNEDSTITIQKSVDGKVWELLTQESLSSEPDGSFTFRLPSKLAIGNKIKIVAKDAFDNESKETILTVQQDRTAPKLVEPKKITIDDKGETVVIGKLSEEGTVDVLVGSKSILTKKVDTDEDGTFTVTIPKQQAKEKVIFVFADTKIGNPNTSKVTVTVTDKTAPEFIKVNDVYNTSRVITGVLNEPGKVTATVMQSGKTVKLNSPTAKWDEKENGYVFTITMKERQKAGAKIQLEASDSGKNTSNATEVIVKDDQTKPGLSKLDGQLIITDAQTSVKGKVTKEGTVQLFVGDQPLHKSAVKTDAKGNFRVSIKKQKAGTVITVKITDYADPANTGEETVTVIDNTKPVVSKVDTVHHTAKVITGKVSEQATVTVKRNNAVIGTAPTDENGAFSILINDKVLAAGEKLTIEAVDYAQPEQLTSKPKSISVRKDTAAPKIELDKAISISTKRITGKLNEAGKVSVSSKGFPTIGFVNTKDENAFTVRIPDNWKLKKGQTITITAEDVVGNKKNYSFKVQ